MAEENRSIIDLVVQSTTELESPERYYYWTTMAAVAATVRKNVFLNRFSYVLYPNLYVILIGKSGLRKGNPVTLAKNMVTYTQSTRVVTGRNSIQAILKEIGRAYSTPNGHGVIKDAHAFLVSGEAASFFVKDSDALNIMTDLYDTHAHEPEWKNTLKSGSDTLKNPCITFLWATNEEHFKEAVADKDVKGGFIARSLVVFENQRRTINSLMEPPKTVPDVKILIEIMAKISELKGEFKISPQAKNMYNDWYDQMCKEDHQDPTGTFERLGDTILKVAMNISLSEKPELCITLENMEEAIDKCIECTIGLNRVTMGIGKSELAHSTAIVLKELLKSPDNKRTRKQLLSKYWGEFDSITLDRVIETLESSGAIQIQRIGKECVYVMKREAVDLYTRFKKGVN